MADPRSEPSMEDILASIKRIIADDGPLPRRSYGAAPSVPAPSSLAPPPRVEPAAPVPPSPRPAMVAPLPPADDDSVLELTNIAPSQRRTPPPPWPPAQDARDPRDEDDIPAQRRAIERLRQSEAASAQARAASVAAIAPEPAPVPEPERPASAAFPPIDSAAIGGLTIEALVREMLRPMLSEWIDTHMPAIVERLVQQEISGQEDGG